jgi:macrolide phosphotransferase
VEPQPAAVAGDPGKEPVVRAADAGATPSVPSVTVVPVPVPAPLQPAVLVTPIPAEPAAGAGNGGSIGDGDAATGSSRDQGQDNPGTGAGDFAAPDDTSTAAISIIDPAKSQASS